MTARIDNLEELNASLLDPIHFVPSEMIYSPIDIRVNGSPPP